MGIYIFNLILILLWALLITVYNGKYKREIFIILTSFQLFILLSLRSIDVGSDVAGYLKVFEWAKYADFRVLIDHRHELGYLVFNKMILLFTTNNQLFLATIAAITVFSVGYFIYKNSKSPFLSYYLYITLGFYTFIFSGLRQAIAFSIIFFSYKYIKEKKLFKFLSTVILASLFHKSALVFIIAYFVSKKKITTPYIIGYFFTLGFVFVFRVKIMQLINNLFYEDYPVIDGSAFSILVVALIVVILSLIFVKNVKLTNPNAIIHYNLVMFSVFIIILASTSTNVLRVANYFYYYIILLIPDVLISIKEKKFYVIAYLLVLILAFVQFVLLTPSSDLKIVPY